MLYSMYFPTFVGVLRELLLFLRKKYAETELNRPTSTFAVTSP